MILILKRAKTVLEVLQELAVTRDLRPEEVNLAEEILYRFDDFFKEGDFPTLEWHIRRDRERWEKSNP